MAGKLYVVGTPIGNLEDISARALRVLGAVDFIAAEDTRVTLKLLNHFGIKKPMISYFEHNKLARGETITDRILAGETAALVTDAGMPAISDPGEDLVRLATERGIETESVPGPSALTAALSVSGMSTARFCFEGFLPVDKKERKRRLSEVITEKRTLVFYEAPHRLEKTLCDLQEALGDRRAAIVKELTKTHETVRRTTLSAAAEYYKSAPPRGEYVLIVEGAAEQKAEYTLEAAVALAKEFLQKGESKTEAARAAAAITGFKKSDIYKEIV